MDKKYVFGRLLLIFSIVMISSYYVPMQANTVNGKIVTETRDVKDFKSVKLSGSADVEIVIGGTYSVEVSAYENLVQHITTRIVDNTLLISTDPVISRTISSRAKVVITMPDCLTSVSITGSGDISLNSAFKDLQTLLISGSGDIKLKTDVNLVTLDVKISGSGDISGSGKVQTLSVQISGSGDINFSDMIAEDVKCSTTGSGDIKVTANNTLKADIMGSGDIIYSGNARVESSIKGSGDLKKK
jgi:hypothetical protein